MRRDGSQGPRRQACYRQLGVRQDGPTWSTGIKDVGFRYATRGGMMSACSTSSSRRTGRHPRSADDSVPAIDNQYQLGLITEHERYERLSVIWQAPLARGPTAVIQRRRSDPTGSRVHDDYFGAQGNTPSIGQMAGMRGLMSDPSGRIIDCRFARTSAKASRCSSTSSRPTAPARVWPTRRFVPLTPGYLTRRLIDVAQDVITLDDDCGTVGGVWLAEPHDKAWSRFERASSAAFRRDLGRPVTRERAKVTSSSATRSSRGKSPPRWRPDDKVTWSALTCAPARGICARATASARHGRARRYG